MSHFATVTGTAHTNPGLVYERSVPPDKNLSRIPFPKGEFDERTCYSTEHAITKDQVLRVQEAPPAGSPTAVSADPSVCQIHLGDARTDFATTYRQNLRIRDDVVVAPVLRDKRNPEAGKFNPINVGLSSKGKNPAIACASHDLGATGCHPNPRSDEQGQPREDSIPSVLLSAMTQGVSTRRSRYDPSSPTSQSTRDISFLTERQPHLPRDQALSPSPIPLLSPSPDVPPSVLPPEFHVFEMRSLPPLSTSRATPRKTEDVLGAPVDRPGGEETAVRLFPSLRPTSRMEAVRLTQAMDQMMTQLQERAHHPLLGTPRTAIRPSPRGEAGMGILSASAGGSLLTARRTGGGAAAVRHSMGTAPTPTRPQPGLGGPAESRPVPGLRTPRAAYPATGRRSLSTPRGSGAGLSAPAGAPSLSAGGGGAAAGGGWGRGTVSPARLARAGRGAPPPVPPPTPLPVFAPSSLPGGPLVTCPSPAYPPPPSPSPAASPGPPPNPLTVRASYGAVLRARGSACSPMSALGPVHSALVAEASRPATPDTPSTLGSVYSAFTETTPAPPEPAEGGPGTPFLGRRAGIGSSSSSSSGGSGGGGASPVPGCLSAGPGGTLEVASSALPAPVECPTTTATATTGDSDSGVGGGIGGSAGPPCTTTGLEEEAASPSPPPPSRTGSSLSSSAGPGTPSPPRLLVAPQPVLPSIPSVSSPSPSLAASTTPPPGLANPAAAAGTAPADLGPLGGGLGLVSLASSPPPHQQHLHHQQQQQQQLLPSEEDLGDSGEVEQIVGLIEQEGAIYGTVFHELIRQVTVQCAERGRLLARVRDQYATMLGRVPKLARAIYANAVAHRMMARRMAAEMATLRGRMEDSLQALNRAMLKQELLEGEKRILQSQLK
ncbi:hypothetical protein PAPYR_3262 [Paratrimastix pyriformis]|uniref:Uncharacterized protein n=1 Tax=Paratrimastix pyriformis TaxID=342808 RepID=A0ABQ8UN65_9EUKA|nr:hypothetical protein PAPYR_3262 [Paratrimastix pyriformis]